MSIDPISNLVSIIKNGYGVSASRVYIPYSKEKEKILQVLKKENYVRNTNRLEREGREMIAVRLNYRHNQPVLKQIKRISKPGQRIYAKPREFKPVLPLAKKRIDLGTTIISTSKGIMTTREAKEKNIGGELILKVY